MSLRPRVSHASVCVGDEGQIYFDKVQCKLYKGPDLSVTSDPHMIRGSIIVVGASIYVRSVGWDWSV